MVSLRIQSVLVVMLVSICSSVHTRESDEGREEQLKIGNLALPGSQQPGSLIGFGQNIVDAHDLQAFLFPTVTLGVRRNYTEIAPSFLYGLRDDLSLFVNWPFAAHFSSGIDRSSGPEDCLVQFEYALMTKKQPTATNQITGVVAVLAPFGRSDKNPQTGFGSTTFFLGATAVHLATEWYCYLSPGAFVTTRYGGDNKSGNQFIYDMGFGRNIAYVTDKWLLMWMIELGGTHIQRDRVQGMVDPNSGGNSISCCPSLWFSTERLIVQIGFAPMLFNHPFGKQLQSSFSFLMNIGWKFS